MADHTEITLRAELPEVIETPDSVQVRCGETECYVYEHGRRGSGAWAVWSSVGGSVVSGGTNGYPQEQALRDARAYVQIEERRRLFHAELRAALAGGGRDG